MFMEIQELAGLPDVTAFYKKGGTIYAGAGLKTYGASQKNSGIPDERSGYSIIVYNEKV